MRKLLHVIYQPYKWIFFSIILGLSTLVLGTIAVLLSFIISPKFTSYIGVVWARLNALFTPMWVSVEGRENILKNKSYVVVSNHQSHYDIFLIYGWIGLDIKWVMKQELRKIPVLGVTCEKMGHIFLDRSNTEKAIETLNIAKKKLISGTSIVMFPEGERSKTGNMNVFKKGAFKMAFDLGLPILPVTLMGTYDILPPNTLNIFPGKAKMIIHKPIDIKKYKEENIQLLMDEVSEIIARPLQKN
jgi:1-acyl-sn-glycerol-3-phosphate acyltransferase